MIFVMVYNFSTFFFGGWLSRFGVALRRTVTMLRAPLVDDRMGEKNEKMRQLLRVGLSFSAVVADGDRVQHAPVSEPIT